MDYSGMTKIYVVVNTTKVGLNRKAKRNHVKRRDKLETDIDQDGDEKGVKLLMSSCGKADIVHLRHMGAWQRIRHACEYIRLTPEKLLGSASLPPRRKNVAHMRCVDVKDIEVQRT
ncbi:hypothetical protein Adt_26373 [Abeliophyllum distichum]|uniref:Uncharacterized protein n=1 Tax=Abeliophyllum distichum TaxID=126358 RepID=A0ABD1RQQ2_9LAMI